jgi:Inner membrane protein YgaP-like, transmembrane domain
METIMKFNVGTIDRVIRVIVGLVLIGLAAAGVATGVWMWVAGVAGVVLVVTGAFKFCPAYAIFGISTCPVQKSQG